jgi:glycosyltransferase involved in cell wall biosynthesis
MVKIETSKRVFCAIMDVKPSLSMGDGFAPRCYHFLKAISDEWSLHVVALKKEECDWTVDNFLPKEIPGDVTILDVGENPLIACGLAGKIRRIFHFLWPRNLGGAHPHVTPSITKLIRSKSPQIACYFLPRLCHLGASAPMECLKVYVLDEGFERVANLNGNLPSLKASWMRKVETIGAKRLYHCIDEKRALVIAISDFEEKYFRKYIQNGRISVVEHCVDVEYYYPRQSNPDFDVIVCGILSHRRNFEPIVQLIRWMDDLGGEAAQIRWLLVGKDPAEELRSLQSDRVTVTGAVADVRPYYHRSKIVVVPAMDGCGVKTTVLQAWAMGKPVAATTFAVNGIPATDGQNILIAADLESLAMSILRLLNEPELRTRIAQQGFITCHGERSTNQLGRRFVDALRYAQLENP